MKVRQMVKKAKKGDKESLLKLIMDQKEDYYKIAYSYMGNQHDALDAMEDMIVKLYEKIDQLKKHDSFYSWSKKILVHCCYSIYRSRSKVVLVDEWQDQMSTSGRSREHNQVDQNMDIHQWLSMINPRQAEAIKLRYFQDLDYQSIANMTNTSLGTVKSRIFNGLKKLHKLSGGALNEEN